MSEAAAYASPNTEEGESPYWDSRNAYNLFKPNVEGVDCKTILRDRATLFRKHLEFNDWKPMVDGHDDNGDMTGYEIHMIIVKSTCLMLAYEYAIDHLGRGGEKK